MKQDAPGQHEQQPALWTLGATAHHLRVTAKFLREQAAAGLIPAKQNGATWLFDPAAVAAALRARAGWSSDRLNQGVDLVTAKQVSEHVNFSAEYITRAAESQTVPHFRTMTPNGGVRYLFDLATVVATLQQRHAETTKALDRAFGRSA
jgi:hypothetical protein